MSKALGGLLGVIGLTFVLGGAGLGSAGGQDEKKPKVNFDAFFMKLDANMDGKISRDEFLRLADRAKEKDKARDKLSEAYGKIDPEKKGITKDQLKKYLDLKKKDEAK